MKTHKLAEEFLKEIEELQLKYQETSLTMGDLIFEKERLEKSLSKADQLIAELKEKRKTLQEAETDLIRRIEEKYGEGQINLQTGEFIPK